MRKILHIFLSLVIVYATTTSAYATTSTGGWSALDTITAGATNTINATKTAGGKVLNSAVTVGASATKVGQHLIKGGGSVALAYAMVELLDAGIDWVLDPANNAVKYKDPNANAGEVPVGAWGWHWIGSDVFYATAEGACSAVRSSINTYQKTVIVDSVTADCYGTRNSTGQSFLWVVAKYDQRPVSGSGGDSDSNDYKYLPIDTVAAKVISNAEAGHGPSQEAVKATALEGFAAGEHDAALDAAAVDSSAGSDSGTENPPDTTNPDNPAPTDPAVPFDPAGIISAINALKALLAGILSSITGLTDFFNSEPPPEKTQSETDVPVDVPPEVKSATEFDVEYVSFGGQCPVLPSFDVGVMGYSSSMSFDMSPLCDLAVTIRPAIIAIAYFIGLGVVASAIRET